MFRRLDREKMLGKFDLWNYDHVTSPRILKKIIERLSRHRMGQHGEMPPMKFGGPWPYEWIDLFNRWVEAQCPRLEQVTTDVQFTVTPITAQVSSLVARGVNPDFGYQVWLEREPGSADSVHFTLFREPPETFPTFGTKDYNTSIDFNHDGATQVFVNGVVVS